MVLEELIPKLLRAGLDGDVRSLQLLAKTAIKRLRPVRPDLADQIAQSLAHYGVGASTLRSLGMQSPPRDQDSRLSLVQVREVADVEPPVLSGETERAIDRFLYEWGSGERLLAEGLTPPTSLLLTGPPGVGKTYLATWIAAKLGLPLLVLDLASAVSAYLGKTGQNLRSVLDYARENEVVLLLDEFDSLAKRRDDPSDLGELKRIVNVLLKELEEWPSTSLIIAATNHPELLDKAIWRRFDMTLALGLPAFAERQRILSRLLGPKLPAAEASTLLNALASLLAGLSGSALSKYAERVLRRSLLDEVPVTAAIFDELTVVLDLTQAKTRDAFAKAIVESGAQMSVRELGQLLECSVGNAQRLMTKHKQKGGTSRAKKD